MSFNNAVKTTRLFLSKNSPTILTGISVVGFISTVIMASKATIKAQDILYNKEREINQIISDPKEIAKETWKCYIPTAISGILTIGCIIGSHYCSLKQKEALSSAYLLSQATLQEYQKKVIDRIGVKKEREMREEVINAVADRQLPAANYILDSKEVIHTGHGHSLIHDINSGDMFYSDLNYVKSKLLDINDKLVKGVEPYFDQNEIRYEIGLPYIPTGKYSGIDVDHLIDIQQLFTPEILENNEVRINMFYKLYPLDELRKV